MSNWTRANRRRESGAIRLWPMMKLIFIFGLPGAGFMLCVWQQTQNALLARDIDQARVKLQEVGSKNHELSLQITKLELPEVLEQKNTAWGLGLTIPYESQIVRMGEDPRSAQPSSSLRSTRRTALTSRGPVPRR